MRNAELKVTQNAECRPKGNAECRMQNAECGMRRGGFLGNNVVADKSFDFAVKIYHLSKGLRDTNKEYDLSRQLLRAGTSIGANVAEGVKGQSKADFISKMAIALKEANETYYWLRLLHRVDLISNSVFESHTSDVNELIGLLTAIGRTAQTRARGNGKG